MTYPNSEGTGAQATPDTLVMACNENYAFPASCALYSIGKTSRDAVERVIILGSDISQNSQDNLARVAGAVGLSLELRDSAPSLEAAEPLPVHGYGSPDAYTRLFIPELCPELERCLYVDADILCLSSLKELLKTDLEGNVVGAAQDIFHPVWGMSRCFRDTGLSDGNEKRPYFNSGVMLIDCEAWRDAEITDQATAFLKRYGLHIQFWDQDALNAVLKDEWQQLDRSWNTPPFSSMLRPDRKSPFTDESRPDRDPLDIEADARIIHFVGGRKPWQPGYSSGPQMERYQRTMGAVEEILEAV